MYVRTRYVLLTVAFADAALFGGGIPLLQTSLHTVQSGPADSNTLLLLLVANVALLLVALAGMAAFFTLAKRGALLLLRRYAVAYVRSNSARRTNTTL